ncbi:MAG: class I SAM-dependent methyltransferase [Sphingomonadaceae bacterium]|nr:class I SAM-dependent methyltransferase [Sphingomonadaceae bacterium]
MRYLAALGFAAAAALAPVAGMAAHAPSVAALAGKAVADPARPASDTATDASRKPAETLIFAGVKPGMTIGEFYPGGGYFTRLLSDMVGPGGHVYGIENIVWKGAVKADNALLAGGKYPNVSMDARAFGTVNFPKPLDIAWVTQNYHDLKIAKYGVVDTLAFDRGVFNSLKPGGIFFILDHEAPPGTDVAAIEKLHRIEKAQVIREVTAAGFRLVVEGTFLRRATDDHTLPIFDKKVQGLTDQYALRFEKPRL